MYVLYAEGDLFFFGGVRLALGFLSAEVLGEGAP